MKKDSLKEGINNLKKELDSIYNFCSSFCSDCKYRKSCNHICRVDRCKFLYIALLNQDFTEKREEEKVIEYPVDMDEMQRNIMFGLLNARKEATDKNILTANGFVAVIDALFYLIKGMPVMYYDSENLKKYFGKVPDKLMKEKGFDKTVEDETWKNAICAVTGNNCSRCTPGPCISRRYNNEKDK